MALLVDEARRTGMLQDLFQAFPAFQKGGATTSDLEAAWQWLQERVSKG